MISDYKLEFEDELLMLKFSVSLITLLEQHSEWLKNCDYHSRNKTLYVHTHNYTAVINWLMSHQFRYGYTMKKR